MSSLSRFGAAVGIAGLVYVAAPLAMGEEPEASLFLEGYTPLPPEFKLRPEAEKRAKALALFYKGKRLEREVDDGLAVKTFREALAMEPANVALAERLAKLIAGGGKYNEALEVMEKCVVENPNAPQALLAASRHCLQHHHDSEAIQAKGMQFANQAVEKFPGVASTYRNLISAYFKMAKQLDGDPAVKAKVVLDRALLAKADNSEFYLSLVDSAVRLYPINDKETRDENLKRILVFADKALETSKAAPEILEQVGDIYTKLGEDGKIASLLEKAAPLYQKVAKAHPDNLGIRHKLASVLLRTGKDAEAEAEYEGLVQINPQDMAAHRALVKLCEQKKDLKHAISHRQEILRWEGGSPNDFLTLAADMLREDLNEEAANVVKRARANYPEDARFAYQMGLIHRLHEQHVAALDCFQEARLLAGRLTEGKERKENAELLKNPDFFYAWAGVAAAADQRDLAADLYRKSIDLCPKEEPAKMARCYNDLGYLWLQHDEKIDEAGELIRTATQLVKDSPGYLDSLGWFHFKKKDFAAALPQFEKAANLSKKPDPEILDHLAQALWQLGKKPEAIAALEKAAALEGAPAAVKERLAEYKAAK